MKNSPRVHPHISVVQLHQKARKCSSFHGIVDIPSELLLPLACIRTQNKQTVLK